MFDIKLSVMTVRAPFSRNRFILLKTSG